MVMVVMMDDGNLMSDDCKLLHCTPTYVHAYNVHAYGLCAQAKSGGYGDFPCLLLAPFMHFQLA
jgi:hypothetical protein